MQAHNAPHAVVYVNFDGLQERVEEHEDVNFIELLLPRVVEAVHDLELCELQLDLLSKCVDISFKQRCA